MASRRQRKKPVPKFHCTECKLDKRRDEFYEAANSPGLNILPDGIIPVCKQCLKDIVEKGSSISKEEEIKAVNRVLQILDKPFILDIWNECKVAKSETLGSYIRRVKTMKQFNGLTYTDSINAPVKSNMATQEQNAVSGNEDERVYNREWMGEYTQSEIAYLNDYYTNLHNDYKIVTVNHKDYARKIAKASLHLDNCFQDVLKGLNGADKKYKDAKEVFDSLSKSAQFAQNARGQNEMSLGCFGRIFERVEAKTYIPEHIPTSKDEIDMLMEDFKHIFKSL